MEVPWQPQEACQGRMTSRESQTEWVGDGRVSLHLLIPLAHTSDSLKVGSVQTWGSTLHLVPTLSQPGGDILSVLGAELHRETVSDLGPCSCHSCFLFLGFCLISKF